MELAGWSYLIGLIIVSMSVGATTGAVFGFLTLGAGLVVFSLAVAIVHAIRNS